MTNKAGLARLIAVSALLSTGVTADAAEGYGWVWANDSTATVEYVPSTPYQWHDDTDNTVLRVALGQYTVYMPDLAGSDGNVQVSGYGSDSTYCKVASWGGSGERTVNVRCFNSAGNAADARFTVLYQSHSEFEAFTDGPVAYLWANNATSPSYTPNSLYQFNSVGSLNTITHSTTGTYNVRIAGINLGGGTVLVTAYGTSSHRCMVGNWFGSGADTVVRVYCHTAAGALVDTQFTLSFAVDTGLLGAGNTYGSETGAYTWTGGSIPGVTALSSTYSWLDGDPDPVGTRTRNGAGRYTVAFEGLTWWAETKTLALVTAYGSGGGHCKVESWWEGTSDTFVNVRCFDAAGGPADSMFDLTFQTDMYPIF